MDYTLKHPGIYLKVTAERGFSKKEVSISFGKGKHVIVPAENVFYKDGGYLTRIILTSLPQASQLARVQINDVQGAKMNYDVLQKELIVITKKELGQKNSGSILAKIKRQEQILMGEAYLEVMVDKAYKGGDDGIKIMFDKGCAQKCSVSKWRTFLKNRSQGLLRVTLREDFCEGLEKIIKIEIPTTDLGRYRTQVPSRYLHLSKPNFYK